VFAVFLGLISLCDTVSIEEFTSKEKWQDDCVSESEAMYKEMGAVPYSFRCTEENYKDLI
jgi:hypothetical protein